jgi:4a-hydroxytetrahydrobiopterin dehydratase
MRDPKLSDAEIQQRLVELSGWTVKDAKLHREYRFPSFAEAIRFMSEAAPEIDKMDHHPEWSNVYNRVTVDLTTHDSAGITRRDFELARLLEGRAPKQ